MNKKILVISASPRKNGNSDILCDEFIRGAKEAGNIVEKVRLSDLEIGYCRGCESCVKTHKCIIKDDAPALIDKMVSADAIVLATPIYFYSMDGQLKVMIDRCVPRYTEMENKEFYYILTAADPDKASFEKTIEAIRGFTIDCLPEAKEMGTIYGTGVWEKGAVKETPAMNESYKMGLRS